jgi:hypothetical protein
MTYSGEASEAVVRGKGPGDAVRLVGDAATLDAITGLCEPWLHLLPGRHYAEFTVYTAQRFAPTRDWESTEKTSALEPPRRLLISPEHRELVVCAEEPIWRTTQTLRSVRHLLRWQAYQQPWLFLHGGMVRLDGAGVAVVGAKKSGKTSTIMAMLAAGAAFVANDDVTLSVQDAAVVGHGWPRTVAIRRDSVLALRDRMPGFPPDSRALRHPANRWGLDVLAQETLDGYAPLLWVDPALLATAFSVPALPSTPLNATVLPHFDDSAQKPDLEQLDAVSARALIQPYVETRAVGYDTFLADWFPARKVADTSVLDAVVQRPVFRLRQSMASLAESVDAIRRRLSGSPYP